MLMGILAELGGSPVARSRLVVEETRTDPLAAFLQRKQPAPRKKRGAEDHVFSRKDKPQ
jgi:hypothetical protein